MDLGGPISAMSFDDSTGKTITRAYGCESFYTPNRSDVEFDEERDIVTTDTAFDLGTYIPPNDYTLADVSMFLLRDSGICDAVVNLSYPLGLTDSTLDWQRLSFEITGICIGALVPKPLAIVIDLTDEVGFDPVGLEFLMVDINGPTVAMLGTVVSDDDGPKLMVRLLRCSTEHTVEEYEHVLDDAIRSANDIRFPVDEGLRSKLLSGTVGLYGSTLLERFEAARDAVTDGITGFVSEVIDEIGTNVSLGWNGHPPTVDDIGMTVIIGEGPYSGWLSESLAERFPKLGRNIRIVTDPCVRASRGACHLS